MLWQILVNGSPSLFWTVLFVQLVAWEIIKTIYYSIRTISRLYLAARKKQNKNHLTRCELIIIDLI